MVKLRDSTPISNFPPTMISIDSLLSYTSAITNCAELTYVTVYDEEYWNSELGILSRKIVGFI